MDAYAFAGPRREGEGWSARQDRMIEALPVDGGTIIVATGEIGRYLMKSIRIERGFAVRKRWRFIAALYHHHLAKLEGLRGRIVVDWTFAEHAKPEVQQRVREAIDQAAAMVA